jgi:hypothetical protein
MRFVIRVDDFGWTGDGDPENAPIKRVDRGFVLAKKFHDAMQGVPYLAGVIPSTADPEAVSWIESKPAGMSVALHGWNHQMREGARNEFEGMGEEGCRALFSSGMKRIGTTRHLIPPFNAITEPMVRAAWHEGIRFIWGAPSNWNTPPSPYEMEKGVVFVPSWKPLYGACGWGQTPGDRALWQAMAELGNGHGIAVVTLHLPWEVARDPEFKWVRYVVETQRRWIMSPEEFADALPSRL